MKKLPNAAMERYSLNEKNSRPSRRATRTDPPEAAEIAVDIKEIQLETTAGGLKKLALKEGDDVSFPVKGELELSNKWGHEFRHMADGRGEGVVASIKTDNDPEGLADEEIVYVDIELANGYAEDL